MPLSSCDWKLLDFRSFICFDVVFFGNRNMAFIRAPPPPPLTPRTSCISETGDPDTGVSLMSGSYLKGLKF